MAAFCARQASVFMTSDDAADDADAACGVLLPACGGWLLPACGGVLLPACGGRLLPACGGLLLPACGMLLSACGCRVVDH